MTVENLAAAGVTSVQVDLGVAAAGDAAEDTVTVQGTAGNDSIAAAASGTVAQVTGLAAQVDVSNAESVSDLLRIEGGGGNDTLTGGSLASIVRLALDAGDGDDVVNGGNGADALFGGTGVDQVDGNQGADTVLLGTGDDTAIWDPGDGSDIVEGQEGEDTLRFNGAVAAEVFTASASGVRVSFTRNVGAITMDLGGVEDLDLRMLGGADNLFVNDLSATDMRDVVADLGPSDLWHDQVTVNGTAAADAMTISRSGLFATFKSAGITVLLQSVEVTDALIVNGGGRRRRDQRCERRAEHAADPERR